MQSTIQEFNMCKQGEMEYIVTTVKNNKTWYFDSLQKTKNFMQMLFNEEMVIEEVQLDCQECNECSTYCDVCAAWYWNEDGVCIQH